MMTYLLAIGGLALLCVLWLLVQRVAAKANCDRKGEGTCGLWQSCACSLKRPPPDDQENVAPPHEGGGTG